MAWAKLDDSFFRHRKARAAGKDGRALFVASLCWCGAQLSNGHIGTADLQLLAAEAEVRGTATARRLVDAGLWEEVDDGWVVHDYLDWNLPAEAELEKRRARAEAGRKGGLKSRPPGSKREPPTEASGEAIASANEKQNGTPSPSPSPSLTGESPLVSSSVTDARRGRVEEAIKALSRADVDAALARGVHIGNEPAYRRSCATARRVDHASTLHALIAEHPDWTTAQLVAAIETERPAAASGEPSTPRIQDWTPTPVPDALERADQADRARALRGQHDRAAR